MTDWYEFGGFQFQPVDSDWGKEVVTHTLDRVEVQGHILYQTFKALVLTQNERWWAITFEQRYQVQPVFAQILSSIRRFEREQESNVEEEQVFGMTKKVRERVLKTLAWIQQKDRELFPPDEGVDAAVPDFRQVKVYHAPVSHSSFYAITPHGVYRVIETYSERFTELYSLSDERVDFVESLIPGRSSNHTPVTEWLMVADFLC